MGIFPLGGFTVVLVVPQGYNAPSIYVNKYLFFQFLSRLLVNMGTSDEKVKVKLRPDGERGLFAIRDIKEGEYICLMPIDYVLLGDDWYTINDDYNIIDFRYGILCKIKKDGSTDYESFVSFLQNRKKKCKSFFGSLFEDIFGRHVNIIGVSNSNKVENEFIGHMINDYIDMSLVSSNIYNVLSRQYSNVDISCKLKLFEDRLGLVIVASRDIKMGEELYMNYGSEYWKAYSDNKDTKHTVKITNIRKLITTDDIESCS